MQQRKVLLFSKVSDSVNFLTEQAKVIQIKPELFL